MNKREFEELKQRFGKETKRLKMKRSINWFISFLSIFGAVIIGYYLTETLTTDIFLNKKSVNDITKENLKLQEQLTNLQELLYENSLQFDSVQLWAMKKTADTLFIDSLNNKTLIRLENKISMLENIIMESPEKSLSIPLLRKELNMQKLQMESTTKMLEDKIDTVVDLNRWILGLIFSLLITIVIKNLFSNKLRIQKTEEEKN